IVPVAAGGVGPGERARLHPILPRGERGQGYITIRVADLEDVAVDRDRAALRSRGERADGGTRAVDDRVHVAQIGPEAGRQAEGEAGEVDRAADGNPVIQPAG